jgi:opacity protein-like surface antigen
MSVRLGVPRSVSGIGAALCCCFFLGGAARADALSGAYVGANFARALNSYNTGFIDQQYVSQATAFGDSLDVTSRSVHRFDDVWWLNAGYFFTPYVGVDAAFLHLGEVRYKTTGVIDIGGVDDATTTSTEITSRGPALSLLGRLPLTDSFEADLRLGDYIGKSVFYNRIDLLAQSSVVTASRTTSSLLAGAGAAYTLAGHWSVRVDYLRVNKTGDSAAGGKFSVNLASAGVSFTF